MIIGERSGEMHNQINLLASLQLEAVRQAVWHKNRSPLEALKLQKNVQEALYNDKPKLGRERVQGSGTYVTIPPEKRTA